MSESDDPTTHDSTTRRAAAQVDWLVTYQQRAGELVEGLDPDQARDRPHSLRQLAAMTPPPHDAGEIETMVEQPDPGPDPPDHEPDPPDTEPDPTVRQGD